MPILKKILIGVVAVLAVCAVTILIYLQTTKPIYSGELHLKDLKGPVTVYHDQYGIPHIYGSNEEDVYRALGYLVAQERLFQMEMIRRVSGGRLAEILGSSMLDVDRFFRTLGIPAHADSSVAASFHSSDQPWQKATLAYLNGINQYIESGKTPVEFRLLGIPKEKFELRDLFLIVDYMNFNFEMGFRTDPLLSKLNRRLGKGYVDQLVLGYTPDQLRNSNHPDSSLTTSNRQVATSFVSIADKMPVKCWIGSNAFAVAPSRSASGKAIFENDTHIGQQQPGVWFEAHIEFPGFKLYGSYLPGFPFAPLGHSDRHAWGVTMFENDDVDFFEEKIAGPDTNTILIRGVREKLVLHDEIIHVKDSQDVRILCRSSSHGPICSDVVTDFREVTSNPVSVAWTAIKFPCNLFSVAYGLGYGKTLPAFRNSAAQLISPGLNVVYANADGNIAWYGAGKLVNRNPLVPTSLLLDGSDSTQEWRGFYDFEDNPKSENPPQGFVFSCNHQPDTINGILHAGYYLTDERARRMQSLLTAKEVYSVEDLKQIALDVTNPFTETVSQTLLELIDIDALKKDASIAAALKLLNEWKGTHTLQDEAPAVYYLLVYNVLHDALADEMGDKDFRSFLSTHTVKYSLLPLLVNDSTLWWDDVTTQMVEHRKDIVTASFIKTVKTLTNSFTDNTSNWAWGNIHVLEFKHPVGKMKPLNHFFNVGPIPAPGGLETINNQSFILTDQFPVTVLFGPALRRCLDFADPLNAVSVLPSGQSGNPMSKHYDDQASMYAQGEFRKEMMDEMEIKKTCKDVLYFR